MDNPVRVCTTNDRFYSNNEKLVLENEKAKKSSPTPTLGKFGYVWRFPGFQDTFN